MNKKRMTHLQPRPVAQVLWGGLLHHRQKLLKQAQHPAKILNTTLQPLCLQLRLQHPWRNSRIILRSMRRLPICMMISPFCVRYSGIYLWKLWISSFRSISRRSYCAEILWINIVKSSLTFYMRHGSIL
jgi:hypothetical protein